MFSQGQFSINLIGTGLKVAEATKWTSQGNYVSVKVHRSEVRNDKQVYKMVVFCVTHAVALSRIGLHVMNVRSSIHWVYIVLHVEYWNEIVCSGMSSELPRCFLCVWFTEEESPLTFIKLSFSVMKLPWAHSFLSHLSSSAGRNKNLRSLWRFLWEVHSPGSQRPTPSSPLRAMQRPNP